MSSSQDQMQKNLMLLALGIGVGATAVYASKKYRQNQKPIKKMSFETPRGAKEDNNPSSGDSNVRSKNDKQKEQKFNKEMESKYFDQEDKFLELKSNQLTALFKKSTRGKAKQQTLINDALVRTRVKTCQVANLKDMYPDVVTHPSPLRKSGNNTRHSWPDEAFLDSDTFVVQEKYFQDIVELKSCFKFLRAGAVKDVVFKGEDVKAAIVTCGGLCPGLNTVIKGLVGCLRYEYGVEEIWGIRWGYRGFYEEFPKYWTELSPENTKGIQNLGGTILGSSRGGFDGPKMIEALQKKGINQLYVIGGDGTHRGINNLQNQLREKNIRISICGVPKTIDNDIPLIDHSFGFNTAVQESIKFIDSAQIEAESAENGVGIIRLMGRHCGYIAVAAALASRDVNICLIPEVYFQLYGQEGVYERIITRATQRGHCVVVVAEGAEDGMLEHENALMRKELGIVADKVDDSGNRKNVDLAHFMVSDLKKYAKQNHNVDLTIKYLNPTYAIRTTPANGGDADLCDRLAHTATHAVQAGYTDFSIGLVRTNPVMIPLQLLIKQSTRQLKRTDHDWQRLIQSTGQPNFLSRENMITYLAKEKERDIKRKEHYLKVKCEVLDKLLYEEEGDDFEKEMLGASASQNY